ncbi:MAG: nucleoside hydrolase [Fibrobacteria bacterium]|nr:nucleoside hydrolase [Fibrobacteria bacterium]
MIKATFHGKKVLFFLLIFFLSISFSRDNKLNVIFDTDMSTDVDDVGAQALLSHFADAGLIRLLAMGNSSSLTVGGAVIDAVNHYYGRPDIPIGVWKGKILTNESSYSYFVADAFEHDVSATAADVPNTVGLYRKALAEAPDSSVIFVTVGFKGNMVSLLDSYGDDISPLTGMQLVQKKVKGYYDMAGVYLSGHSWNFWNDPQATQELLSRWPTKMVFVGDDVGLSIITGKPLYNDALVAQNPVALAYRKHVSYPHGRCSWDPITAYIGVLGLDPYFWLSERGCNTANSSGDNTFIVGQDCDHYFVKYDNRDDAKIVNTLDSIMLLPPTAVKNDGTWPPLPDECYATGGAAYELDPACTVSGNTCTPASTGEVCVVRDNHCYVKNNSVTCSCTADTCITDLGSPIVLIEKGLLPEVRMLNGKVNINYSLKKSAQVQVDVFDASGRLTAALYNGHQAVGQQNEIWDGNDMNGRTAPRGVYLARIKVNGSLNTVKFTRF